MKLLEIFKSADNIQLDKKTLVILRWIAIVGQIITINVVYFIFKFNFPYFYCFVIKNSQKSKNSIKKNTKEFNKFMEKEKSKINIQRFKGLGEMNPEELWETTLNPEKRILLQVKYTNNTKAKSKKDQDLIQVLMGDEVAPRKNFIINRALEVSNLDI